MVLVNFILFVNVVNGNRRGPRGVAVVAMLPLIKKSRRKVIRRVSMLVSARHHVARPHGG